jgi:hypothetical protein
VDVDKDGLGGDNVPKYAFAENDNRLLALATEQLPGQGLIVVSGAAFMSNFEVQATIEDSGAEKNYSNYRICENLLKAINPVKITPIAEVQAKEGEGYKFRCGMVGIQYIFFALSRIGRGNLAYRIMTETTPGYRSWFEKGETTLWEKWDGENHGSHNHHMLSGVIAWFYTALLGIEPVLHAPAFAEIDLRPNFVKALGSAEGYLDTVRGRIAAEWHFTGDRVTYTVTVPAGVTAYYNGQKLQTGKNIFQIKTED